LVRQPDLVYIAINDEIFVPVDRGYALMILDGPIALLQNEQIKYRKRTTGAMGIETNTSIGTDDLHLASIVELPTTTEFREAPGKRASDINLLIETVFYLMKDQKIYAATKRNYLRLYPEIKPQLEKFLSENKIDFKNEQHLRGLSKYCNSLLMAK
jgi:hypothetical protein